MSHPDPEDHLTSPPTAPGGELVPFPHPRTAPDQTCPPEPADQESTAGPNTTEAAEPDEGQVVEHHGRAVNPVGWNPGADLPDLGPWLPSRAQAGETARWAVKWAAWHARFHARRSPTYAGRVLVRSTRATGRGARWWAVWVYAPDQAAQVRSMRHQLRVLARESRTTKTDHAARDAALAMRGMALQTSYATRRLYAWRAVKIGGTAALGAAALSGVESLAQAQGGFIYPVAIACAASVAAVFGRKDDDRSLIDNPAPPARIDLKPDHLNAAFRAAGLLKGDEASLLLSGMGIGRQGRGWAAIVDLPRGGGKTAADAIAKRNTLAAELGVDEIQLIMSRVRAAAGGHAGRLALWVADDDPYLGEPVLSELIDAESFDFWQPVPFGKDARGDRILLALLWQSAFFGGLPRRGKTFSMRLLVAAGVLDAWVRLYLADGKGGADFRPVGKVAHRYVQGADEAKGDLEAFEAMFDELITEMSRRYALFATLPTSMCPEGKLTPEIMRTHHLPLVLIVVDELQEYLEALDTDRDRSRIIGKMARIARRGPAAGFIPVYASQRPDAKSVPTKLREIVSYRYCTQVVDKTSSDMVLGDGKANQGADASTLSEEHVGVGVLVTGPASHVTVKADLMDNIAFEAVCQRGRTLREQAGTLSGEATGNLDAAAGAAGYVIPTVIADVLEVMGRRARIWTDDLLAGLVNLDEDTYGDYDAATLAAELEAAGVKRSSKQVRIGDGNRAGYYLRDIEGALPAEILTDRSPASPAGGVEGAPSTPEPDPDPPSEG